MLLNDKDIRKLCQAPTWSNGKPMVEPFSEPVSGKGIISYGLTHAGYDIRLGPEIWMFKTNVDEVIDPRRFKDVSYRDKVLTRINIPFGKEDGYPVVLDPHSYVLGVTLEYFCIPRNIKARVVGKSTLARCAILINTTPAEPLWEGHLTLEIGNLSPLPAVIFVGQGIAQMEFEMLSGEPEVDYAGKGGIYQGQLGVTPARVKE